MPEPNDYHLNKGPRSFQPWVKIKGFFKENDSRTVLYQGEWVDGEPEGRGIMLIEETLMALGYFKEGKWHGLMLCINAGGTQSFV